MAAELFFQIKSLKTESVIFLDRDGVINRKAAPHEYITDWENFIILPGVYDALKMFNDSGRKIFIVTNQRCIARKIITCEKIHELHERMLDDFVKHGCHVDGIFICPHSEKDNCECRKPKPGLLISAQKYLEKISGNIINKKNSWIIGDSESDIEAGKNFGINALLIDGVEVKNLFHAAKKILNKGE